MNLLENAIRRTNSQRPPVWLMRQAGRYHAHYQDLKKKHTFVELCKNPKLACETTMGPIRDFDFDAAILFSDILFPLETMGMGLRYDPGPKLDWQVQSREDLQRLATPRVEDLQFQGDALRLIRDTLPPEKSLLGFVGGPFTLFTYSVEGTHQGDLAPTRKLLRDRVYAEFYDHLGPLLLDNMLLQARSGADAVAVLDTCAGGATVEEYAEMIVPTLRDLFTRFKSQCDIPVVYYSKTTTPEYWDHLDGLPIDCLGIDWNPSLPNVLEKYHSRYAIQGNFPPESLLKPTSEFETELRKYFESIRALPAEYRKGWICGLGHGVIKTTPEAHVRTFVKMQREIFG